MTEISSDMKGEAKAWPVPLQWHSELHRRWELATLQFWFIRFGYLYEREPMFDKLVAFLEGLGIKSYSAYELGGEYDVMLRLWVPMTLDAQFADELEEEFHPTAQREYVARDVIRHWPWRTNDSLVPKECDPQTLAENVTPAGIESVNDVSDYLHGAKQSPDRKQSTDILERFMSLAGITDLQSVTGIRLAIRLKLKDELDHNDVKVLARNVTEQLDAITWPGAGSEFPENGRFMLSEVSLYLCKERSLLILCRVPYRSWHSVREHLLDRLAFPGILQTTMFPALSQGFVRSRDHLTVDERIGDLLWPDPGRGGQEQSSRGLPVPPRIPPSIREYLDRDEDDEFESKGSAFTRLDPWLSRDWNASETDGLTEEKGYFRDTIGKTVVAMLNTNGGTIAIGLLQPIKFADRKSDVLKVRIAELPTAGEYAVLGLQDPIFLKDGWDGFDQKFNRLLTESIDGDLAGLVHVHRDWHREIPLALVEVQYPGMEEGFYLRDGKDSFVIRRGGSNEVLSPRKAQVYIRRAREREARD